MSSGAKRSSGIDWLNVRERLNRASTGGAAAEQKSQARVQTILQERARHAAQVPTPAPAAGALLEIVRFTLGDEQYALETIWVREVLPPRPITPLPGTPEYLAGIVNLRGQIVAVFDLRRFYNLPAETNAELSRVIVMGQERIEFGILANDVHEVALLRLDAVREAPGTIAGPIRASLRGVAADALCVLDGAILLKDPRLYIDMREETGSEPAEEGS